MPWKYVLNDPPKRVTLATAAIAINAIIRAYSVSP